MNIRVMMATDQVGRLVTLLGHIGLEPKVYANRGTTKTKRVYITIDDREADRLLKQLQNLISTEAVAPIKEIEE